MLRLFPSWHPCEMTCLGMPQGLHSRQLCLWIQTELRNDTGVYMQNCELVSEPTYTSSQWFEGHLWMEPAIWGCEGAIASPHCMRMPPGSLLGLLSALVGEM